VSDGTPQASPGRAAFETARLTPYELVFAEAGFEARIFPGLRDEADAAGNDPASRERFAFLSLAGDALRDIIPAEAPREALEQHRALLFHSFNFWRFGRRFYLLERAVARYLVEGKPSLDRWDLRLPHPAVYVQLPSNLFWASIAADVPPEPVDGFFAVESRGTDPIGPAYRQLEVLMVLGIRRDRAGFSIIPFDLEVGPGIGLDWLSVPRDGGDFSSVLPGGAEAGLYSILTASEALKLLARALWYVEQHPEDVVSESPAERRHSDRPGTVSRSRLPFCRVRFAATSSTETASAGDADSSAATRSPAGPWGDDVPDDADRDDALRGEASDAIPDDEIPGDDDEGMTGGAGEGARA
jgi:hypothetical protein